MAQKQIVSYVWSQNGFPALVPPCALNQVGIQAWSPKYIRELLHNRWYQVDNCSPLNSTRHHPSQHLYSLRFSANILECTPWACNIGIQVLNAFMASLSFSTSNIPLGPFVSSIGALWLLVRVGTWRGRASTKHGTEDSTGPLREQRWSMALQFLTMLLPVGCKIRNWVGREKERQNLSNEMCIWIIREGGANLVCTFRHQRRSLEILGWSMNIEGIPWQESIVHQGRCCGSW